MSKIAQKNHETQILSKPREVNLRSIHLKVIGIKVKRKPDQMVKKL